MSEAKVNEVASEIEKLPSRLAARLRPSSPRNYFGIGPFWSFSFINPVCYFRLFSHVLGHGSWSHLHGNLVNTLLVGPSTEREFGPFNLLKIMLWTAAASGVAHMAFGSPNAVQLGASGCVFMLILLNSLIEAKAGRVPLTFLCQVMLWCSNEVISQFSGSDGISHIAHLSGAVVGTFAGYQLHGDKVRKRVANIGSKWLGSVRKDGKRG